MESYIVSYIPTAQDRWGTRNPRSTQCISPLVEPARCRDGEGKHEPVRLAIVLSMIFSQGSDGEDIRLPVGLPSGRLVVVPPFGCPIGRDDIEEIEVYRLACQC